MLPCIYPFPCRRRAADFTLIGVLQPCVRHAVQTQTRPNYQHGANVNVNRKNKTHSAYTKDKDCSNPNSPVPKKADAEAAAEAAKRARRALQLGCGDLPEAEVSIDMPSGAGYVHAFQS